MVIICFGRNSIDKDLKVKREYFAFTFFYDNIY